MIKYTNYKKEVIVIYNRMKGYVMKKELENLLSQHEEFLVEGVLNKNELSELARKYDSKLLNVLMKEEKIKNHFFSKLEEGILVFKKDVFLKFLNNKEFLPDSFTVYKSKIGLGSKDGSLLSRKFDRNILLVYELEFVDEY